MSKLVILAILGLFVVVSCASQTPQVSGTVIQTVDSQQAEFDLVQIVDGLDHPWGFAFLPDGDILITERPGSLLRLTVDGVREVSGLPPVTANGQGGLLDVILHPDYERTGWIYFTYSARYDGGLGTTVARAQIDEAQLSGVEELFRINAPSWGGRHFGSRMAFDADGYLYITVGDRGERDRAQDTGDHAGSVIRLNDDGSIPADNPFVGESDAAAELYSYGHRNAQGIALHPETGAIWLHEHGPQGGDEVNVVRSGANYGWPLVSYGDEYGSGVPVSEQTSMPGVEEPLLIWKPSIAPSGMAFYTGDRFPEWHGDLFVGALAGRHLRRVELDRDDTRELAVQDQEVLLEGTVGRIRDVRPGPDGMLYLITDEDSGGLYRLEPAE